MSYTVTKYPPGTFSWTDITSTNMEASKKFMMGLLGWTVKDMPMGNGMDYSMFYIDGNDVAGGSQMMPDMAKNGMHSVWNNYVSVENVDDSAKKAVELGATIVMPAMDVLDAGRMAALKDPTGAVFMIWEPKKHIGAKLVNTTGAMVWNELYTHDLEKAKDFYSKLFGWTYEVMKDNPDYFLIKNNGRLNGGMMAITKDMEGMPPNWTVYFTVANLDEATKKVKELGGVVHMVKDIGVGEIGMVTDPAGAGFIIMTMKATPEEWKE